MLSEVPKTRGAESSFDHESIVHGPINYLANLPVYYSIQLSLLWHLPENACLDRGWENGNPFMLNCGDRPYHFHIDYGKAATHNSMQREAGDSQSTLHRTVASIPRGMSMQGPSRSFMSQ